MIVVLLGVAGSGKTTVGELLAKRMQCRFYDADALHGEAAVAKMRAGIPLTDADRECWLTEVRALIDAIAARSEHAVLAFSGLRRAHRERIRHDAVRFVYLKGSRELLRSRLEQRRGHFFPAALLASQLAALEEPADAIVVGVREPPHTVVAEILRRLDLGNHAAGPAGNAGGSDAGDS
jgi:gluconokinase